MNATASRTRAGRATALAFALGVAGALATAVAEDAHAANKTVAPGPATGTRPASAPAPSAPRLDDLLARFARAPGIFARFREEKHLSLLDAPLVNEGTIHFAPPGRLARHTARPLASTLLIDGGKLTFGDAEGHQSMDLGANPVARAFVDSFLLLLKGDRSGLERLFTMTFTPLPGSGRGDQQGWKLSLVPRTTPMDKLLSGLVLRGKGLVLEEMEIRETSGDWSRTVFSDVDVAHAYPASEQARVFRIPTR